ncbi:MAG: T9SS type A sorting domain-containing protein, partial [Ignavibacteriae bacterium]|nr:T9SS type A sorting domain-containing protein [Ignavibacteriota bacterium]
IVFYSKVKDLKHHFDSSGSPVNTLDSDWVNQLVCIYIEFTPKSSGKEPQEKNQVYLWYKPTTDFLDYLPEDIAEPVWAEMSTPKDRISSTQTGRFTDSWRDANVLLSSKPIYPNPASGKASLDFSLTSPTTLNIALFDITGKKIKDFVQSEQFQSGSSSVNLPLDGLTDGMYLVVITPNNALPVVQRIMIAQ